jgi:hypothetical protein
LSSIKVFWRQSRSAEITLRFGRLPYASFFVVDFCRGPGRTRSNRLGSQTSQQVTTGSGGVHETMNDIARKLKRTMHGVCENSAKDIAPTRRRLNEMVGPFALIVLGKGRVAEWCECVICIASSSKAAVTARIVFVFTVLKTSPCHLTGISGLLLFLAATLILRFWLC